MLVQSYAGTRQQESYWYNESPCNERSKEYTTCMKNSAGALVYRVYAAYYGKEPALQQFSANKQKLLNTSDPRSYLYKARESYQQTIICELIMSKECRVTTQVSSAVSGSNYKNQLSDNEKKSFANILYKNALNRSPNKRELDTLVAGKQYSHTKMVAKFAKYPGVATVMNGRFLAYLKSNKNVSNKPPELTKECPKDFII